LKAKRRGPTSNKLKRVPSTQLEAASREELLEEERLFNTFATKIKPYLPGMGTDQRDALLRELHSWSNVKIFLDGYAASERTDAQEFASRFRKYRLWLVRVDEKLTAAMKAMEEAVPVANSNPRQNNLDELETLIVRETLFAIVSAGKELGKAIEVVRHIQYDLAAATHPTRRNRVEKKLVPVEPEGLEHTNLPLSERTRKIDLWFTRKADDLLSKYRRKDGRSIPNHDQIIVDIFKAAFDVFKSAASIRRELSPSRRKKPRPLF
jgi:hypothetical protein